MCCTYLSAKSYSKVAGDSAHIQSSDCAIQRQIHNFQLWHILLGRVQGVRLASNTDFGTQLLLLRRLKVPVQIESDVLRHAFPWFLLFQCDDVILCELEKKHLFLCCSFFFCSFVFLFSLSHILLLYCDGVHGRAYCHSFYGGAIGKWVITSHPPPTLLHTLLSKVTKNRFLHHEKFINW